MNDKQVLVDVATRVAADVSAFASLLQDILLPDGEPDDSDGTAKAPEEQPRVPAETPKAPEEQTPDAVKKYTYEEARAVLAEKSRNGFRAEVKAILTGHGVKQLSDVRDPALLAAIVAEAEAIHDG
jgi:hypothetical protein